MELGKSTKLILGSIIPFVILYLLGWFVSDNSNWLYIDSDLDWLSRSLYLFFSIIGVAICYEIILGKG